MNKIKFTREELRWIERTADIETAILFNKFNNLLLVPKDIESKARDLIDKQLVELIELYHFLKSLRVKLELWDCRFDIDTEVLINVKEKKK